MDLKIRAAYGQETGYFPRMWGGCGEPCYFFAMVGLLGINKQNNDQGFGDFSRHIAKFV